MLPGFWKTSFGHFRLAIFSFILMVRKGSSWKSFITRDSLETLLRRKVIHQLTDFVGCQPGKRGAQKTVRGPSVLVPFKKPFGGQVTLFTSSHTSVEIPPASGCPVPLAQPSVICHWTESRQNFGLDLFL